MTNNQNVYGLVQCTPDLSKQQCSDCIRNATALLPECCNGRQGGRVVGSSCQFRYEISAFYASEPPSPSAAPGPAPVSGITPSPNSSLTPPPPPPTSSVAKTAGMGSNIVQTAFLSVISILILNKF